MSTTTDTPQVWIACLQSYNNGRLIGEWVDATDMEYMTEAVERIKLAAIKAAGKDFPVYFTMPEEFAIHDYNNFPGNIVSQFGEYPNWKHVVAVAAAIEEHGDMFRAWLEFRDSIDFDEEDIIERCQEQYEGQWDDEESYVRDRVMSTGLGEIEAGEAEVWDGCRHKKINRLESIENYIDWDTLRTEWFDHGTLTLVTINGTGYVFDSES